MGVTRKMHSKMSQLTRKEVLAKLQRHYLRAGTEYKTKLINQAMELFGYHRKAAIRALRRPPGVAPPVPYVSGRSKEYEPQKLLPVLKPIRLICNE